MVHQLLWLVAWCEQHLPSIRICTRARKRDQGRNRGHTTSSSRQIAREIDIQLSITSDSDSDAPTAQLTSHVDQSTSQVNPLYGSRRNRVPRYRSAIALVSWLWTSHTLFQLDLRKLLPQPLIHNGRLLVNRVVIRGEKTYTGLERERIFPVDVILEEISKSKTAEESCPCFKEWASDLRGCEFSLAVTMPPVTPKIVFGPFNYEREPIQMVCCITADLISHKYGITCQPGEEYRPTQYRWILVTASHAQSLVQPDSLRSCLEFAKCGFRGTHSVLPHCWSFLWKTPVLMVARADYHFVRQIPVYPPFGWLEPFF